MKTNATLSMVILVAAFLLFTALNNLMFGAIRLDLTQNDLYTLSEGTKEIIGELDEPVNLYFFYSDKVSEDLTSLRAYAKRVEEMLQEYQLIAGSKINLKIIDPEPFSEEEEQAAEFGLQSIPLNQTGDELYFGLVGTNAVDGLEIIAFFQPDREEFLEYELSKLIYNLGHIEKPRIGVYAGLEIYEAIDPQTYQATPAWVFLSQLKELFVVDQIDEISIESLQSIDLLLVVHPKALSEQALFAIDQHVMSGKKLIAFIDPLAEMDRPAAPGMSMGASSSELNRITASWGVTLREGEILGDSEAALMVSGANGAAVRHLGILGFSRANLSSEDVVTAPLESINMATVGILDVDDVDNVEILPLIVSSRHAGSLPSLQFQFLSDPSELQNGFSVTGEQYIVALRLSGKAISAFPDGIEEYEGPVLAETSDLQVVIVADTDLLSDRLWVQVQNFFGQQIASAFADNGSFVTNLVDNLSGSSALIDVRSRGQYSRPFLVVEQIRREAEERYLQSAEDLQARLEETERQLSDLETARVGDGLFTLTREQEQALVQFQNEKLKIRKDLRDVRHQLDKDIEELGAKLKFLNILLLPLLLTVMLIAVRLLRLNSVDGTPT
jgi:ABC-type uncharacterized transport system involved in gliding motility auxiliary subunit